MIIRLCYGRRVQTSLKLIACALTAIFYFGFLFRESMNAFEQNKDKAEAAAVAIGLIQSPSKGEVSLNMLTKLFHIAKLRNFSTRRSQPYLNFFRRIYSRIDHIQNTYLRYRHCLHPHWFILVP